MKDVAQFLFVFLLLSLFAIPAINADAEDSKPAVTVQVSKSDIGAKPTGLIAFISDGDIWVMDTEGKNRQMVTTVTNAKGRLSFSPDNKIVAFSREGKEASQLPSGEGGSHLLHDIFLAYLDSAATRPNWWKRLTFDLGAFQPEWSADGKYVYYQNDINAGYVDYIVPSHQIARIEVSSSNSEYLRKDWQVCNASMLIPTVSTDAKKVAFVTRISPDPDKYDFQNLGIVVLPMDSIAIDQKKLRKPTKGLSLGYAPSWSPDGQWLAYVLNDIRNPSLLIVNSDLSETRTIFAPTPTQQAYPHPVGWSPDSKWIVFATRDGVIYTVDINGEHLRALTGPGPHSNPAWSK